MYLIQTTKIHEIKNNKSNNEWQPSLKTPGKQRTCSSGCRWLSKGEMRSPSTALSPPSKRRCGLTCLLA